MATILGTSGSDVITGGTQNDIINGLAGDDVMSGGKGNDIYYVDNPGDDVFEQSGQGIDTIISTVALSAASNEVENYDFSKVKGGVDFTGNSLHNVIKGGAGVDTLRGGQGNDTYYLNSKFDYVEESGKGGIDTIVTAFSADLSSDYAGIENITLLGTAALKATGDANDNNLTGNGGANVLDGKTGADTLVGGKGNDTYHLDDAADVIVEYAGEGIDTVISTVDHVLAPNVDRLILAAGAGDLDGTGNGLRNTLIGNEGDNDLDGDGGADTMIGGKGNDTYAVDHAGDKVVESANEGTDDRVYSFIDFSLANLAHVEHLNLLGNAAKGTGNALSNSISGNLLDNMLNGGAGADTLAGGAGNDVYYVDNGLDEIVEQAAAGNDTIVSTVAFSTVVGHVENYDFSKLKGGVTFTGDGADNIIKGGTGADTLAGKAGDDTYYLNSSTDGVTEAAAEGVDTIAVTFNADLADYDNVEIIRLLGAAALKATGNANANILYGNAGANLLDGAGGADVMLGGKGNDTYRVDNATDIVGENAGEGTDTVVSSLGHTLAANVENLVLTAGAGNINGGGNGLRNRITGNEGNNVLDGDAGNDTLKGGKGDDLYRVDSAGDIVIEAANEGSDWVASTVSFSLANLAHVENLQLLGTALRATGNARSNLIYGNDEANIINGGVGADFMAGGKGSDTYYLDNIGDTASEMVGEGTDTVISTVAFATALANIENYDFSKLKGGITFTGNDLTNVIKGGAGIDNLAGGKGSDTYYLNSAKDSVFENANEGTDSIAVTFSANLASYDNIEGIQLLGTAALKATGDGNGNSLYGNSGANILDGKGGSDVMAGGKGNDTYYVDDPTDLVIENAKEGSDRVVASVTYELSDNVEQLTLAGGAGAINGTGNFLANRLTGNESANVLNGKEGADLLIGGKGDDVYYVDHAGDRVIENANQGTDWVFSTIDFSLASLPHVENLQLQGSAVRATGNARQNQLFGNSADNIIDGRAGADLMMGGGGNDTYYVDVAGDLALENAGEGNDTIVSTIAFGNAMAEIENYDFSKLKSGIDFTGTAGDNIIKGGAGIDTLTGGLGNDTYYLNSSKDSVIEQAAGGSSDTIAVTFSANLANYSEVENIRLLGTAALGATGTAAANMLWGNGGANTLDGKGGADTMTGGKGNDTYHVDHAGDEVVEASQEGTDRVISTISHTLEDNVETLFLAAGAGNLSGYGNALRNTIIGNEGINILDGKGGNDTLRGGKGSDFYIVDSLGDRVIESANEGTDRIYSSISLSLANLINVEELQLVDSALSATGNTRANHLIGNNQDNQLNGGKGADTLEGGNGNDTYIVDNLADEVIEVAGAGFDTVKSTIALSNAIDNIERYDFSKVTTAVTFTGNALGNTIYAGARADLLAGGDGSDIYYLNNAEDTIVEAAAQGADTAYVTFAVSQLWDNVENLHYRDTASTATWNGTGNGLNNFVRGNDGRNVLNGADGDDSVQGRGGNDVLYGGDGNDSVIGEVGNDTLFGGDGNDLLLGEVGNDRLTGGAGVDAFRFRGDPSALEGHDVITDFDKNEDLLWFFTYDTDNDGILEQEDFVAGIIDQGAGQNVVVQLLNGGSITFLGAGTGAVGSLDDLVANPATQIDVT